MIYTLQFGTYTFPNQTFEIKGHDLGIDTPVQDIRRQDGGIVLDGYLAPKQFLINGKVFGENIDSMHNSLNTLYRAMHNKGQAANFLYRADRQVLARLAPSGISGKYTKGLYEHLMELEIGLIAAKPYAEATSSRTVSGSRSNNSNTENTLNAGNYPTAPVFTFIAGANPFSNDLYVLNTANCLAFRFQGPLAAGQTLVVDCDGGCVLMHVGSCMVDAISYFSGDLNFVLEGGGTNVLVIDAASLTYAIVSKDRWYI